MLHKKFLLLFVTCGIALSASAQHRVVIRKRYQPKGYPNVLTVSFPHFIGVSGTALVAAGFEYERFIVSEGSYVSVHVPVYTSLHDLGMGSRGTGSDHRVLYCAPGVRLHPMGNKHRADVSIDLQVPMGQLKVDNYRVSGTTSTPEARKTFSLFGFMGEADLDLHATEHFLIGLHTGVGALLSQTDRKDNIMLQFGVKIGGRF